MRAHLFLIAAVLCFYSCTKTELETVPDNLAPPDPTIETVTIENYITRTYILALGREPSSSEFSSAFNLLSTSKLDSTSRSQFISSVLNSTYYLPNVYAQNKIDLLNNADTSEFTQWITIFEFLLTDSANIFLFPILQAEILRLEKLQSAFPEFTTGSITLDELHRRMCNNYIYDQINMGSANFVISSYQHLLNRNPTGSEQTAGVSMVESNNAVLFLQAGSSKTDYLNIISNSRNYHEAQVVYLFQKYLNRVPTTQEMNIETAKYVGASGPETVQIDILSTNEFVGIQ